MKYLRAIEPEDLDLMYVIENDMQLWKYGSTTVPFSRYALKCYLEETKNDIYKDGQVRFAIINEGTTFGFLDLTDFIPQHSRAQIGIVLTQEAQHKGIAAAALREAIDYARQTGIHQLYAVVNEENLPAINLFTYSGFVNIATLPDWLKFDDTYSNAILYNLKLTYDL